MANFVRAFLLLVGLALFVNVLTQINLDSAFSLLTDLNWKIIFLMFFLVLEVYLKAFRFKSLISFAKIPTREIFKIIFETTLISVYTPARAGDVYKLQILKDKFGVKRRMSGGAMIIERVLDLLIMVLFGAGTLVIYNISWQAISVAMVFFFIVLFLTFFALKKFDITSKYTEEMAYAIEEVLKSKAMLVALLLTPAIWAIEVLIPYYILLEAGYQISFFSLVSIYYASSLIALLSMIPGGLGSLDISFLHLLISSLDIERSIAVSVVAFTRFINLIFALIGYVYHLRPAK